MSRNVRLKPEAAWDIEESHAWYSEQSPGLGVQFARELEAVLERVAQHPEAHAVVEDGIRRALLRRFPYGVFYLIEESEVIVIAVMHCSRAPRKWSDRA